MERRSLTRLGFDPDATTVHLDDALGDRQAEAGSALLARDRAVGLLELLEDFRLIDRGNAWTRVAYRNRERSIRNRCPDRHLALIGELDRVADQVEQDLREPPFVAAAGRQVRRDLRLEGKSLLGGKRFDRRHYSVHYVSK